LRRTTFACGVTELDEWLLLRSGQPERRHNAQGHGIGSLLLLDAIRRTARISLDVGFEVLVVHALNSQAAAFYQQRGFVPFDDHPLHLFLTTKQIRRTLEATKKRTSHRRTHTEQEQP
jgi:N-acetylglutamate synthase-like GNAT family acetyltransferase